MVCCFSNLNEKRKADFKFEFQCSVTLKIEKPFSFVLCLNFSIEAKIKTLFLISDFNLSKRKLKFRYTDCIAHLTKKDFVGESINEIKNGKAAGQSGVLSEMVMATEEA